MRVSTRPFGTLPDGTPVTAARLENASGASVTILDYGATIQSLCVPGRDGRLTEVVLGYDTAAEYAVNGGHLGGTIGRVGNRIGGARFSLGGKTYELAKNNGANHLHGGVRGFDKFVWDMRATEEGILCERLSPDGEEGYPGNLRMCVTFTFSEDHALRIAYDADTDADTLVNPTNHAYFNLNGGGDAMGHWLQIFADRFCENDAASLPTGRLLDVAGTPFDFRAGKPIGTDIGADDEQLRRGNGYDHNFCLGGARAAILRGEQTGIEMTTYTDMPGVQLYTANGMHRMVGHGGAMMAPREAVCLETQLWPNGMNCWGFPSPVLRAGQHLHSETTYAFSVV